MASQGVAVTGEKDKGQTQVMADVALFIFLAPVEIAGLVMTFARKIKDGATVTAHLLTPRLTNVVQLKSKITLGLGQKEKV